MSESTDAFASHILDLVKKELSFLKENSYLSQNSYNDILRLLPAQAQRSVPSGNGYYPNPPAPTLNSSRVDIPSPTPQVPQQQQQQPPPPTYDSAINSLGSARALYDYNGQTSDDLSFRQGEIIQVTEHVNDDWSRGLLHGRTGLFPRNYVQFDTARDEKPTPPGQPPRPSEPANMKDGNPGYNYPIPASSPAPAWPNAGPAQTPYSYPPPPAAGSYGPPPAQAGGYAPPPPPASSSQYAPPPQQSVPAEASSGQSGNKMSDTFKKFGGKVADAATWGFGATVGSDVAHALF